MSAEYRPVFAIPFRDIDKRLEKHGIKVDMSDHTVRLTGPNGTLVATPEGGSTHFERNLRADTEAVLNAIQTEYGIEIVDEDDPRFWGYASWDDNEEPKGKTWITEESDGALFILKDSKRFGASELAGRCGFHDWLAGGREESRLVVA